MKINAALGKALSDQRDRIKALGDETAAKMTCPTCSMPMKFIEEDGRYYYVCQRFPVNCDVSLGAHPDGRPMGKPGDSMTRRFRALCHRQLNDMIDSYRGPLSKTTVKNNLYSFISEAMGIRELHFGNLNQQACRKALDILKGVTVEDALAAAAAARNRDSERIKREKWMAARGLYKPNEAPRVEDEEARRKRLAIKGIYLPKG